MTQNKLRFERYNSNQNITMKRNQTYCLQCGLPLVGRADKKYCDDGCRNSYHNARMMDANRICRPYHRSLKQNYSLLFDHLQSGQNVIHKDELMLHGFDPKMSTTFQLMEDGTLCYGVYDLEYFELKDRYIQIRRTPAPKPPGWKR